MLPDISPTQIYQYAPDQFQRLLLPLFLTRIAAGFPSPAEDYADEIKLDLNELCIENPDSTFLAWVQGESMLGAGINPGDLLVIDKSLEARSDQIVVAVLNGEFTLKRLVLKNGSYFLYPENPAFKPIQIGEGTNFEIWGVVVSVVRVLNSNPVRGRGNSKGNGKGKGRDKNEDKGKDRDKGVLATVPARTVKAIQVNP